MMEKSAVPFGSVGDGGWDDAYFNAMFSGVSLQSFLSANQNNSNLLPPSLYGSSVSEAVAFPDASSIYYPQTSGNFVTESTGSSDVLKWPKSEPLSLYEAETESVQIQSFDFIHETSYLRDSTSSFNHLPDLRSLEQSPLMCFNKRARVDSVVSPLDSMVRSCESFQNNYIPAPFQYKIPPPDVATSAITPTVQIPRSALARQRRQKLSDKTRCLQKLLPWDKKMDIATMLEEAYKYVKFLQAQLLALQSMPNESAMSSGMTHYNSGFNNVVFSGLETLNRNQLLQILVNSPVAQTMLCSQSWCVFSAEQLGLIQKTTEKRVLQQQQQQISTFRPKH